MKPTTTTNRADRVAEAHTLLLAGAEALVTSADWAAMLAQASRFHTYSPRNQLLIGLQCPTATRVAGYRAWQALGRQVRQGEKGLAILAPCVKAVEDDNGEKSRRVVGFRVATVFDVAQTDGEPLADVAPVLLEGDAGDLWGRLAAQVEAAGYTLERGDCPFGANGVTMFVERTVRVRADVSDAQACKTLAHELAHVLLHDGERGCRGVAEVEAESVAFVVLAACGLDAGGYTLPYVASWSGGDVEAVRATSERVLGCAKRIVAGLGVEVEEAVAA